MHGIRSCIMAWTTMNGGVHAMAVAWTASYNGVHATTKASPPLYRAGDAETSEADITYAMSASRIKNINTWDQVLIFYVSEAIFYFSSAAYNSSSAFGASPLASASSWTNFEPMMAPLALA